MARVAQVHWQFYLRGGGENVAMNVLEALQTNHEVILVTDRDVELRKLNDYYGTAVDPTDVEVVRARRFGVSADRALVSMRRGLGGSSLGLLRPLLLVLAHWTAHPVLKNADLVVNTTSEMGWEGPSIQYVHYPLFNRYGNPQTSPPDNSLSKTVNDTILQLEGLDEINSNSHLLTNSSWTADLIERTYRVRPDVLHPPVDARGFESDIHFSEKEQGFVILGRISPGKNILEAMDIIDRVQERGYNVHLHVVGSTPETDYVEEVRARAERSDTIVFNGEVSRSRLVELLQTHRFGIHAKRDEHFGMAIAEMVAAGAVPFVPRGGGQVEIVNGRDELLWSTPDEAVEKIVALLNDSQRLSAVRASLPDVKAEYGQERFREEFCDVVTRALHEECEH
jgi:glycosyltransferase involved in cell wall biosynthesis